MEFEYSDYCCCPKLIIIPTYLIYGLRANWIHEAVYIPYYVGYISLIPNRVGTTFFFRDIHLSQEYIVCD